MDLSILHIDQLDIAIPMDSVREVLIRPTVSLLPLAPDFLIGVTGFRGIALPVIELLPLIENHRKTAPQARGERQRVVVCQLDEGMLGLRVDLLNRRNVEDLTEIPSSSGQLLHELSLPDETTLHLLHLPELFTLAKSQMKPQLEHIS